MIGILALQQGRENHEALLVAWLGYSPRVRPESVHRLTALADAYGFRK
jgi:hypothetical protein